MMSRSPPWKSFDGIHAHTRTRQHLAQQNNLGAKRRDDADRLGIKPHARCERRDEIHNRARLFQIGAAIAVAFHRNEDHRHGVRSIRRSAIVRRNACFQAAIVEEAVGNIHDLRMHPILRFQQCDGRRVSLEPFEHRVRQSSRAHDRRQLTVVADENETRGPKDQPSVRGSVS
jgi:hypothetical protein